MRTKIIKVTDKGQISIPVKLREVLGIGKGDELVAVNKNDSLVLKKLNQDDFSDILKLNESSLDEIWNNEKDEIWSQYLDEN